MFVLFAYHFISDYQTLVLVANKKIIFFLKVSNGNAIIWAYYIFCAKEKNNAKSNAKLCKSKVSNYRF
jgi:hypothetical protein